MSHRTSDDPLRQLLQAGDPLPPGEKLSVDDARRMRRAVLAEAKSPAWTILPRGFSPIAGWRLAAVAAAAAAVMLLVFRPWTQPGPSEAPPRIATTHDHDTAAYSIPEPPDRQIQFVTRGGTRVIWMLKPRLDS